MYNFWTRNVTCKIRIVLLLKRSENLTQQGASRRKHKWLCNFLKSATYRNHGCFIPAIEQKGNRYAI